MALPEIPQNSEARETMLALLERTGVFELSEIDMMEFLLRFVVADFDWIMTLRTLAVLSPESRTQFFEQVFEDGEYNSVKAAVFFLLNVSEFQDHVQEWIEYFEILMKFLMGEEIA